MRSSPKTRDTLTNAESCHYLFLRLRSVAAWIRTPQPSACEANSQTYFATAATGAFSDQGPIYEVSI